MSTAKQLFHGTGKAPAGKSTFATTCNRLSLFLKERGSLLDLGINGNFNLTGKPERAPPTAATATPTFDLLSNIDSRVQTEIKMEKSMISLPQYVSLDSFSKSEDCTNKASSNNPAAGTESKTAQMTIFYRGQVLVFDDIPADKAKDLMLVAKGASPSNDKIENRVELASTSNCPAEVFRSQEQIHAQLQSNGSDLPIARRASLHKFLAKRKDRATVRAPYQLHHSSTAAGSSNHKFDLNL